MTNPHWLPNALRYADYNGEWDTFMGAVYQTFERDFKQSRLIFQGLSISYDSRIQDGKEAVFWHIISRTDSKTGDRELDLRRCERIPWVKPIIDNSADAAISIWRAERKKPNKKLQTRIYIWLEELNYIVVLSERPTHLIFVTSYCTDIPFHRMQLQKERDAYYKKQKPPQRAT